MHLPFSVPRDVVDAYAEPPELVLITGPRRLLCAAVAGGGSSGRAWFDLSAVLCLNEWYDRIPIPAGERRDAILAQMRSMVAASMDWVRLGEFFLLEIPPSHSVEALVGTVRPQPLYALSRELQNPALLLRSGVQQYYFAAVNPQWVVRFGEYFRTRKEEGGTKAEGGRRKRRGKL